MTTKIEVWSIKNAEWRTDLGRGDEYFGLSVSVESLDGGHGTATEYDIDDGVELMRLYNAVTTSDLIGKRCVTHWQDNTLLRITKDKNLKPCPFCGSNDVVICNQEKKGGIETYVKCNGCAARVSWCWSSDDFYQKHLQDDYAITRWNRRCR